MVKQLLDVLDLWQQLLNDSAECLIDGVIVDACKMVTNLDLLVVRQATHGVGVLAQKTSHVA